MCLRSIYLRLGGLLALDWLCVCLGAFRVVQNPCSPEQCRPAAVLPCSQGARTAPRSHCMSVSVMVRVVCVWCVCLPQFLCCVLLLRFPSCVVCVCRAVYLACVLRRVSMVCMCSCDLHLCGVCASCGLHLCGVCA